MLARGRPAGKLVGSVTVPAKHRNAPNPRRAAAMKPRIAILMLLIHHLRRRMVLDVNS